MSALELATAIALGAGAFSLLAWLAVLLHPARPWDARPVGEDEPAPTPDAWPEACAIVPARNETLTLPATLPALLGQDYPGRWRVVLVDDRSDDGTADAARRAAAACGFAERLVVVQGAPLPPGWIGKVWALEQGLRAAGVVESARDDAASAAAPRAGWVLLTDADILHAKGSVRSLVADATARDVGLDSRMARLRCASSWERLLIPPFTWFFGLLYPMRWVADPVRRTAAAAGGCMLLSRGAVERLGGLACIRDRVIDDVSLARAVKDAGFGIRLALSRGDVASLRAYDGLDAIWRMVRRTAFTELKHSGLRLLACVAALVLVFVVPPLLVAVGAAGVILSLAQHESWHAVSVSALLAALGAGAWTLMALAYAPAIRFFGLRARRCLTLPLAGVLYGAMTVDSAWRHATGRPEPWRSEDNSPKGTTPAP